MSEIGFAYGDTHYPHSHTYCIHNGPAGQISRPPRVAHVWDRSQSQVSMQVHNPTALGNTNYILFLIWSFATTS